MTSNDDNLSTLIALFPKHSRSTISKYLDASNGNLERAYRALERGDNIITNDSTKHTKRRKVETGLKEWLRPNRSSETTTTEVLVLSDSDEDTSQLPPTLPHRSHSAPSTTSTTNSTTGEGRKPPLKSAFALLRPPRSFSTSSASRPSPSMQPTSSAAPAPVHPMTPTHINLPPLILSTPAMIARETRGLITLVENALPEELAARLFVRMVEASEGLDGDDPWKRNKWFMVDREVESPHTSAFYTEQETPSTETSDSSWDQDSFNLAATHWYNGEFRQSRPFLPEMNEARHLVAAFVNTLLEGRERNEMEWTRGSWRPNAAAANCYRGSNESVGWHSDQLTHLGPYPTIASLTLGCTRPFRLRPFSPQSLAPSSTSSTSTTQLTMRTLEILLPHNSLLIMHASTQETFKHSVPPMNGMDIFRLPRGSLRYDEDGEEKGKKKKSKEEIEELSNRKWRERINMTFRHYRPDFAPAPPSSSDASTSNSSHLPPDTPSWISELPNSSASNPTVYAGTPTCRCGKPAILRPDGKGRVRSNLSSSSSTRSTATPTTTTNDGQMVFFWSCNAGSQNEGKGCGFFKVLDMERERRGKWFDADGGSRVKEKKA